MNPSDPLSQLKDIHLPDVPGLWPPAPGWWVLAIALVVAIVALGMMISRRISNNRYRKIAAAEANALTDKFQLSTSNHDYSSVEKSYIEQAMLLLKRTALHRHNDDQIATSSANRCLALLNQRCKKPPFSDEACALVERLLYQASSKGGNDSDQTNLNIQGFHQMMKTWIKTHR